MRTAARLYFSKLKLPAEGEEAEEAEEEEEEEEKKKKKKKVGEEA